MSSFISNSDTPARWRRFFRLTVITAAGTGCLIYAFVVLIDPWGSLPLSLPLERAPVTSNQRFAYPAIARSPQFDSAVFGTSTSRLLRPAGLDPAFGARFANLAMNDATAYEISRLLLVFAEAHPAANVVMIGLDAPWCATGGSLQKLTPRPFPEWMYGSNRWSGYASVFNLFAVQEAGKEFGVLTGLKREDMGRDGYTRFVPPDDQYDPVRAASHLRAAETRAPPRDGAEPPATWHFPALDLLRDDLAALPAEARKILFFVPYNRVLLSAPGTIGELIWNECKLQVAALARATPGGVAVDFMLTSPITTADDNYWDPLHYRVTVAARLESDLAAAAQGEESPDYRLLIHDSKGDTPIATSTVPSPP
jgi:hypothetical protein